MNLVQHEERLKALEAKVFGSGAAAAPSSTGETPLQKAIREAKEKSK